MINGGMASVEEIRNALIAFKDSCDKPVYACADKGILGQKAYYLATVADKIVVHPEVSVDFRGLGGEMMFYKDQQKFHVLPKSRSTYDSKGCSYNSLFAYGSLHSSCRAGMALQQL